MLAASSGHTSQSLEDKLYALKYFISGQGISFVIVKATTSELIGPKKKHLKYLITTSNEPNVSIPSMVKHLVMRAKHPDWTVVFKSLITMHQLMTYGNENFLQNISSSAVNSRHLETLCSFSDTTTSLSFSMSIYLRRYARYMCTKIRTYRTLGLDFCRIKPTLRMREVTLDQILQTIPKLQEQFDTLLAFDTNQDDLCNGIINSAFMMLYKDFVKLYIIYQAAVVRLLELYFASDNPKEAREMLQLYKRFLVRMDKVSDFMPVIDSVGMDKSDLPNLSRVPNLPFAMLERHLEQLEGANKRIYERSLGRLDYGTLGRPRRRSIKTPTRQTSLDILSPMAVINYRKRNEELKHLDQMLGFDRDKQSRQRSREERDRLFRKHIGSINEETRPNVYDDSVEVATIAHERSFMSDNDNSGSSNDNNNNTKHKPSENAREIDAPAGYSQLSTVDLIELPDTTTDDTQMGEAPVHGSVKVSPARGRDSDKNNFLQDSYGPSTSAGLLDKDDVDDDNKALTSWMRA